MKDLRLQRVQFHGFGQRAQVRECIQGELVICLRAPKQRRRRLPRVGGASALEKLALQIMALGGSGRAIGSREIFFLLSLRFRPVGVARRRIDHRQSRTDPPQVRHLLQRLAIEEKGAAILPPLEARACDQSGDVWRFGLGFREPFKGTRGHRFIGFAQTIPGLRVGGIPGRQFAVLLGGVAPLVHSHQRSRQHAARITVGRFHRQQFPERRYREARLV